MSRKIIANNKTQSLEFPRQLRAGLYPLVDENIKIQDIITLGKGRDSMAKVNCNLMNIDLPSKNGRIYNSSSIKFNPIDKYTTEDVYKRIREVKEEIEKQQKPSFEIFQYPISIPPAQEFNFEDQKFKDMIRELIQLSHDIKPMSSSMGYEIREDDYDESPYGYIPFYPENSPQFVNKLKLSSIYGLIPRGNTRKFSIVDYIFHKHYEQQSFIYYDPRSQYKYMQERYTDEYRKFIEESKYKGFKLRDGQISIPRVQCTKSNGNNIRYDSRRIFDDMGK